MRLRFPDLLALHLRHQQPPLSANAFSERVKVPQSTMSRIMLGQRPPDVEVLDAWADALDLSGQERDDFILAGALAHTPKVVQDLLDRNERELAAAQRRIEGLSEALTRLESRLEALTRERPRGPTGAHPTPPPAPTAAPAPR